MREKPGTFAANCLLARRLAERGVRFIQLYHRGWDQHGNLPKRHSRPVPGDVTSHRRAGRWICKQRGLLDDTLVVWGGEFGRTIYSPGQADARRTTAAIIIRAASRSGWPAAASSRAFTYGETDDFGYNVARRPGPRPRPARDDPALLGIDHERLTFKLPGPPLPPDRRPRQGREVAACVNELTLFLGRFHPLLVHFPIVLLVLAGVCDLCAWWGRRTNRSGALRAHSHPALSALGESTGSRAHAGRHLGAGCRGRWLPARRQRQLRRADVRVARAAWGHGGHWRLADLVWLDCCAPLPPAGTGKSGVPHTARHDDHRHRHCRSPRRDADARRGLSHGARPRLDPRMARASNRRLRLGTSGEPPPIGCSRIRRSCSQFSRGGA